MINYLNIITMEPGKRGGKPCIRGLRITVYDILEYLASGMSIEDILSDFPELERDDIIASLAFAADRERRLVDLASYQKDSKNKKNDKDNKPKEAFG